MSTAIATGFTAMADATTRITDSLLKRIKSRCLLPHHVPVQPHFILNTWDDVYDAIQWNMQRGSGSEHTVADEAILQELSGFTDWNWKVGGTGLQAACAASIAGYSALASLAAWTEEFDFLLKHDGLEVEIKDRSHIPIHYVLEYQTGVFANRVIFRKAGELSCSIIALSFTKRLLEENGKYRWLLISGYNACDTSEEIAELIQESKRFMELLKDRRPPAHLELGAILSLSDQQRIIEELGPLVESLGLNEDELGMLHDLKQPLLELNDDQLIHTLLESRSKFGVKNLIVHTAQFAACISKDASECWKDGLYNGVLMAAAKAAEGRFCTREEMSRWEAALPIHPRGARLAGMTESIDNISIVPSFKANAVATIGLGDTFTAGLLTAAPLLTVEASN